MLLSSSEEGLPQLVARGHYFAEYDSTNLQQHLGIAGLHEVVVEPAQLGEDSVRALGVLPADSGLLSMLSTKPRPLVVADGGIIGAVLHYQLKFFRVRLGIRSSLGLP